MLIANYTDGEGKIIIYLPWKSKCKIFTVDFLDFRVQSVVQVLRILCNLLLALHFRDIEFSQLKLRVSYIKLTLVIYNLYILYRYISNI